MLEMVIVISIVSIVSGILVYGFKDYGVRLNLRTNANEVALAIREAQAYALAVRGFDHDNNSGTILLYTSWGVYAKKSESDTQLKIFVDFDGDKNYDDPGELSRVIILRNGIKIYGLWKGLKTTEEDANVDEIEILYQRPNPDTKLLANDTRCSGLVTSNDVNTGTCPDLEIILQAPNGAQKTVVVWSTGQVTVE